MENDRQIIINNLRSDAERLKDAWPDAVGEKIDISLQALAQEANRIGAGTEQLLHRTGEIWEFCTGIIEGGEEEKKLTLHR